MASNGALSFDEFEKIMDAFKREVVEEATANAVTQPVQFLKRHIDHYEGHIEEYEGNGQVVELKLDSLN